MSLCDCAFGPRCESIFNCEDEPQPAMGLRDARTGTIRARADFSIALPARKGIRFKFYCAPCLEQREEAVTRKLPGIDPPEGASEFWKPSIREHIRLVGMELRRQEIKRELEERGRRWMDNDIPLTRREKQLTPAQWQQVLHVRRMMREDRSEGRAR